MKPVALFLLLATSGPADAQLLWQNVNAGMTGAQVRSAQPSAEPYPDTDLLYSGAGCLLRIPDYEIGPHRVTVCFYMLNDRVSQVTLKMRPASERDFWSLAGILRATHGREIEAGRDLCHDDPLGSCRISWMLPNGVDLNMGWYGLGDRPGFLNINYQPPETRL